MIHVLFTVYGRHGRNLRVFSIQIFLIGLCGQLDYGNSEVTRRTQGKTSHERASYHSFSKYIAPTQKAALFPIDTVSQYNRGAAGKFPSDDQ
jgi:hypothetical protein